MAEEKKERTLDFVISVGIDSLFKGYPSTPYDNLIGTMVKEINKSIKDYVTHAVRNALEEDPEFSEILRMIKRQTLDEMRVKYLGDE